MTTMRPTNRTPANRTWGDLLDEMAAARPEAEAVVFRDRRLTYAELRVRVDDFARALLASGIGHGDRVALLLPNRPGWLIAALATVRIGGIVAAISTFSTARELGWTLEHSGAAALVMQAAVRGRNHLDALRDLCPELAHDASGDLRSAAFPDLRRVVCIDAEAPGVLGEAAFLARGAGVPDAALDEARARVRPDDLCYILYTSGSTAAPKGVTLAHGPVIANGFDIGERMHLGPDDRVWLAVPLFWSFGSANALPALMTHGGCLVLQESFEPGEALDLIERERCTVYYGMANMARAMLEHPRRADHALASMRTGLTIGLPEDIAMTMDAVGARELCNVYGATETYGNCAVTDAHDPLELRLTSQGLPLPGMEIRAVDPETRAPLPPDAVGELCVRGYVTPGYYRSSEPPPFDAEGWFLTGDLGSVGSDGRIRFRGRLKEMIKTGGINVAPLEVEAVLMQHPAVKQAYVVGVPDRDRGEIVAAAIELHEGATADAAALTAWCRERLAGYKVPTRLSFRTAAAFPRTPTGKIHKPGLRRELGEDHAGMGR